MKLIYTIKLSCLLLSVAIFGCTTSKPQPTKPALLKSPSVQTRITLETAIGKLLNSKKVKLADTAFTQSSTVMIEQSQHTNNQGRLLESHNSRPIDSFILLFKANTCTLKHQQSLKELTLSNIECVAVDSDELTTN